MKFKCFTTKPQLNTKRKTVMQKNEKKRNNTII